MLGLWPLSFRLVAVLVPAILTAQSATLRVRVIDQVTNQPLPNAEVMDRVDGTRRFTNEAGEAELPRGRPELALRVRQLGFQFVDRTIGADVDTASFEMTRCSVDFRLTGLKPGDLPRRLEGYTTFRSPTPFIVVPDTTTAMWWRRNVPQSASWGNADAVQRIALKEVTFLRKIPPAFQWLPR